MNVLSAQVDVSIPVKTAKEVLSAHAYPDFCLTWTEKHVEVRISFVK